MQEISEIRPLLPHRKRGVVQAFFASFSSEKWPQKIGRTFQSLLQKAKNFGSWWVESWQGVKEQFSRHFIQQPIISLASGFFSYCYFKIASYKLADFSPGISIPFAVDTMLVNGGLMDLTFEDIFKKMDKWSEKGWKKFGGHVVLYLAFIALALPAASPLFISAIEADLGLEMSYALLVLRACAVGRSLVTFPDFAKQIKQDHQRRPALFWVSSAVALGSAGYYTYSQLGGMREGKELMVGQWGGEVVAKIAQVVGAAVAGIFNFEWIRGGIEEVHDLMVESTAPASTFLLALGSGFVGLAQATTQVASSSALEISEVVNALCASVLMNFRSSWRNREESGALISRAINGVVGVVDWVSSLIVEGVLQNILTRPLGWLGVQAARGCRSRNLPENEIIIEGSTNLLLSDSLKLRSEKEEAVMEIRENLKKNSEENAELFEARFESISIKEGEIDEKKIGRSCSK